MELIVDWELATGRLCLLDRQGRGTEHQVAPMVNEAQISRLRVDFATQTLSIVLPDQGAATLPFQLGEVRQQAFLAARPIVYLDQNQWSKIDAVLHNRDGVSRIESAAATILVLMAQQGRIVLPLSAGHAVETGAMYGLRRTQLASTMLELSQGWLMRNPTWIKEEELTSAKLGRPGPAERVFTQDADQWFTQPIREPRVLDAPEPMASLNKPIVNALSIASMLLSPEQVPDEGGRAAAEGWAGARQGAADHVRADQIPAQRARVVANAQILADAAGELLRIWGPDNAGFKEWVARSYEDVSLMPSLSRVRAIFYGRLRSGARWEGNDLTDVMYLSTAAGYADLVVGERHTIAELRTSTQVTSGARVASSLKDAVAELVELHAVREQRPGSGDALDAAERPGWQRTSRPSAGRQGDRDREGHPPRSRRCHR